MKSVSSILFLFISLVFFIFLSPKPFSAEPSDTVLLIIKERFGPADIQFEKYEEAILMKQTLEKSGYRVHIASALGRTFVMKEVTLESDYKLTEVIVEDYIGFIITCSDQVHIKSTDRKQELAFGEAIVKPEEVAIVKKILDSGKPLAAQHAGVIVLAQAGALEGKKYSYDRDLLIRGATYGGDGVIQDGNVITSTYCPHNAEVAGEKDQTTQLTKTLIGLLEK